MSFVFHLARVGVTSNNNNNETLVIIMIICSVFTFEAKREQ